MRYKVHIKTSILRWKKVWVRLGNKDKLKIIQIKFDFIKVKLLFAQNNFLKTSNLHNSQCVTSFGQPK